MDPCGPEWTCASLNGSARTCGESARPWTFPMDSGESAAESAADPKLSCASSADLPQVCSGGVDIFVMERN